MLSISRVFSNLNVRRIGIIFSIVLLFSIALFMLPVEKLVRMKMRNELVLKPGTELRELWTIAPFPLTFKVYVFNITNPEEVAGGEKPHVSQIGPYIFDEWKTKEIIEDNDKDDTVTYDMKNTFIFRPDLTAKASGLTGNEIITMPHLIVMGGLIAIQRDSKPLLDMAINALTQIFKPTSPFLSVRIMDILFDGLAIDCSGDSFLVKSVCVQMKERSGIRSVNSTHLAFSLFGGANASSVGRFTVYRGVQDISKLGEILTFNDEEEVDAWDGECNKITGTDSTIFAPFHQKSDILSAFAPDFCRSLAIRYVKASSYQHVPTGLYSMDFGDIKNDPGQQCFCRQQDVDGDEVEICPPRGTIDLHRCNQSPLLVSKPHFLDADEKLLSNVDGLRPNRNEHDINIQFEMISTTPLAAAKRLQFSLDVEAIHEMPIMSQLKPLVLPLFWIEESVNLNSTYTGIFRNLYIFFTINSIIKYTGVVVGASGLIIALLGAFASEASNKKVKTIQPSTMPATVSASSNAEEEVEKSELEKERY